MFIHPKLALWITAAAAVLLTITVLAVLEAVQLDKKNKALRTSLTVYKRENDLYARRERSAKEIAHTVYKRRFDSNLAMLGKEK